MVEWFDSSDFARTFGGCGSGSKTRDSVRIFGFETAARR